MLTVILLLLTNKIHDVTFEFNTYISELRMFLNSLHMNFKNQSLENDLLNTEMSQLVKRNDHFKAKLFFMLEI